MQKTDIKEKKGMSVRKIVEKYKAKGIKVEVVKPRLDLIKGLSPQ
ncbi:hypothetical protein [Sutcliffiella rhizosphaerae]|uniref:Transposase n=1 Tax=Sutcliffiella rhizosphaerae TaxID=2880967 RepID=A0ABN8AJ57_9BACI|nr:hypothetical protein [Sutcliffiella rhizosphaerae]CAG9622930.1 hypothetical protein BACCIP111883_03725 [Sutcliffiella rhizosphaerae]